MDVNTALGYDDDHKHRVISVRAAGGKDEVFRRTRGSSGQNKRSRSMKGETHQNTRQFPLMFSGLLLLLARCAKREEDNSALD